MTGNIKNLTLIVILIGIIISIIVHIYSNNDTGKEYKLEVRCLYNLEDLDWAESYAIEGDLLVGDTLYRNNLKIIPKRIISVSFK